jgi:asparagine synthase (glutamine-hydrolysing)
MHVPRHRRSAGGADAVDSVRLLAANPDAELVDSGAAVWFLTAVPDPGVRAAVEGNASFEAVRDLLVASGGEYSLARVSTAGGLSVSAHRGVTSGYEIFLTVDSEGRLVVTDLFRNALAGLRAGDRTVTREIVADHLLYRTVPAGTYVEEVARLGHGETLHWTPADGNPERAVTETLRRRGPRDVEAGVEALDTALRESAADDSGSDPVTMLSGGVDSTLLGTYAAGETPSASAAFETPEFEFEVAYARTASDLLDTDHELVTAPEGGFCRRLEETIDAIGMPPQQFQAPTIDLCYRGTDHRTYVSGETADSLYGLGAGTDRLVWATRALRHLPAVHPTLRTHAERADRLVRSPWDPRGTAQKRARYLPLETLGNCVDPALLERRQLRRLLYARERVPLVDASDAFAAHMEWGHWLGRLCENTLTAYRQLAHARGKAHRAPFATRAVAEAALSVPSPARYVRGRESKPIPKRLLAERLPAYDVSKSKGNGNLPVRRFLREDPLSDAERRYALPEFAPDSSWEAVVERSHGLAWILLSWAIWRDRVLEAEDVAVAPHTHALEL